MSVPREGAAGWMTGGAAGAGATLAEETENRKTCRPGYLAVCFCLQRGWVSFLNVYRVHPPPLETEERDVPSPARGTTRESSPRFRRCLCRHLARTRRCLSQGPSLLCDLSRPPPPPSIAFTNSDRFLNKCCLISRSAKVCQKLVHCTYAAYFLFFYFCSSIFVFFLIFFSSPGASTRTYLYFLPKSWFAVDP